MNYQELLVQAFKYPFKRKEIFVFGLIIAFISGLYTYFDVFTTDDPALDDVFNQRSGFEQLDNTRETGVLGIQSIREELGEVLGINTYGDGQPIKSLEDAIVEEPPMFFNTFGWLDDSSIGIILLLCCSVFIIASILYLIAVLYFSSVSNAAIIKSVQADQSGIKTSFKSSWLVGRKYWKRLAGLSILFSIIIIFIVIIPTFMLVVAGIINEGLMALFLGLLCIFSPVLLIVLGVLSTYFNLSGSFLVVENVGVRASMSKVRDFIRKNFSKFVVYMLISLGIGIISFSISFLVIFPREIILTSMEVVSSVFSPISVIIRLITNLVIALPISGYFTAVGVSFTALFVMEVVGKKDGISNAEEQKLEEKVIETIKK